MGAVLSFAAAAPACVLGLPYCNFVPLAVWQGIVASLVAVFFFLLAVCSTRPWLVFPAGVFTAISLALRHDQAVYTIASIVALTVALGFARGDSISRAILKRALLLWLAGIVIVLIPAIVVWWTIGALPEMFRQLILFPITTYRKTSSMPFPRLTVWRSLSQSAVVLCFTFRHLFSQLHRFTSCDPSSAASLVGVKRYSPSSSSGRLCFIFKSLFDQTPLTW